MREWVHFKERRQYFVCLPKKSFINDLLAKQEIVPQDFSNFRRCPEHSHFEYFQEIEFSMYIRKSRNPIHLMILIPKIRGPPVRIDLEKTG